jgi:hypothetical protein
MSRLAVAVDRHRPSVGFDVGNQRLQLRGVEIGAPLLGIVQIGNRLCSALGLVGSVADDLHRVDRHHGIRDLRRRGAKAVFFVGLRILHGFVHQADAGRGRAPARQRSAIGAVLLVNFTRQGV